MEKEGEKIIFVGVWLERRAECKLVEWGCFLSRSTKILSPKIEEINREKKASCLGGWKNKCVKSTCSVVFFFGLFIYLFWFSSLVFVFFCTSHFFFSPILDAFLLSRSTKILSPEIEEKNKEKKVSYLCGWKNQCVNCTWFVVFFFDLLISFFFFFLVFFFGFCLFQYFSFFSHLFWILFSYLGPPKFFLLKSRRKIERKDFLLVWMKEPMCKVHMVCHFLLWPLYFFFGFLLWFLSFSVLLIFFSHLFWMLWLVLFLKKN